MKALPVPDYPAFLAALKDRILHARTSAIRAVNRELILLYWDIGRGIVEKQRTAGWGDAVVEQLAADLQAAFPDMRGFSARNLRDMKRMWQAYSVPEFWRQAAAILAGSSGRRPIRPQAVAKMPAGTPSGLHPIGPQAVAKLEGSDTPSDFLPQVVAGMGKVGSLAQSFPETLSQAVRELVATCPWGHHRLILDKLTDPAARLYYLRATAQLGWSRSVLLNQIKAGAYERAVKEKKTHNFALALPEHLAEQAGEMMKSRYNLEFLGIGQAVKERELEDRLLGRLQQFILSW